MPLQNRVDPFGMIVADPARGTRMGNHGTICAVQHRPSEVHMDLDAYFDFLASDDIRIKNTRIGIESILYEYIHRGQSPEAIAARFHTVRTCMMKSKVV